MTVTKRIQYFVLLLLIAIPLFQHLGAIPILTWDEARLAINTYEMQKNQEYLVTYFEGTPDMWNTKPPLLIWLQVLSSNIFGISEFSMRLPSAIAALFTCLIVFKFSKSYFQNFWMGVISVLILITSTGYVSLHGTRTLDYDALLTLFSTLSLFSFFKYVLYKENKYLYWFFISLSLGVLTKSITILMFMPALLIFILFQKQLLKTLRNKHFYFSLSCFIIVVLSYYLLREWKNPGYIQAVYNNELGGRYLNVIENHKHGFWYYYENIINLRFNNWYLLIPIGFVAGIYSKNTKVVVLTQFLSVSILVFFLVISTASTKLLWYDIPLFPLLSILASFPLFLCFNFLKKQNLIQHDLKFNLLPFVFLFLLFITPYRTLISSTYKPELKGEDYVLHALGYHLKGQLKEPENLNNVKVVYDGYNTQILYYLKLLQDKGINIHFKNLNNLLPNDTLILSQDEVELSLRENYSFEQISDHKHVKKYIIHGRK